MWLIVKFCDYLVFDYGYGETYKKYDKQIIYYDFSKIPDNLVLDKKIKPPKDLKKFLGNKWNNPRIKNHERFEQEFWEEANKLGYTLDKFRKIDFKEAVIAAVEIVAARLTYYLVDDDKDFIKKYGEYLPHDVYFHLKLGDCDKYRDTTIAAFNIIKKLNPRLQNIYLSIQCLGGNFQRHAWVSIIIPQKDYLALSHIDPTLYDNGGLLEVSNYHICLEHSIFIAYFYKALHGYKNLMHTYQILHEEFLKTEDRKWQEILLRDMSLTASSISIYKPKVALNKVLWAAELYEAKGFTKDMGVILYSLYEAHLKAGNKSEAEKYKQRLLKEFPNSFWTNLMKLTK